MATCVRCKSEIEPSLKYCPICGAKQNMHIDANQVVSKNLIDDKKFDASNDVLKTPKVEIIIDDSEAATPFTDINDESLNVNKIDDLPSPVIDEADDSDYKPVDVKIIEVKEDKPEAVVETYNATEEIIEENNELSEDEIKSKKVNIFNTIFNLIITGVSLFFVGFPYFYETSNMLIIRIARDCKRDLVNITSWDEIKYYGAFGVISLAIALIFFVIYILKIFISKKPKFKDVRKYRYSGLSMAFIFSTLYFNTQLGNFKLSLNYFFRIYSYIIILLIIVALFVNMICRIVDPLALSFRWGYVRYNINNYESLPKIKGMNKYLRDRKLTYILLISLVSFIIYLRWLMSLFNNDPNTYTYLISRYVTYKAHFNGLVNIFKPLKNILDMFYIHGYPYHVMIYSSFFIISMVCIIGYEYWGKRKLDKVSKASTILFIISIFLFSYTFLRGAFALFSIIDGAGVNESIDPMIIGSLIGESLASLAIVIIMILERYLNKHIARKKLVIFKQE